MVVSETETETEVIVTGMAAADETTTSDRENDTTMAMAMTIQEAKEGIKSQVLHRLCYRQQQQQQQQQQHHGLLVATLCFTDPRTFISSTSRLSFNKSFRVCWWVPYVFVSVSVFDFSSPSPPYFSFEGKKGIGSRITSSLLARQPPLFFSAGNVFNFNLSFF